MAIIRFKNKATEDIFHGESTSRARLLLHPNLHSVARRRLHALDAAPSLGALKEVPSYHCERRDREHPDQLSIRLTARLRIVFRFDVMNGEASDVQIFARLPAHPGEHLREDFLPYAQLSAGELSEKSGVSLDTIQALLAEQISCTAEIALRIATPLNMDPIFLTTLQNHYDLAAASQVHLE